MTIQDALDTVDEMKPNMMKRDLKLRYLSEIEGLIWEEIVCRHYDKDEIPQRGWVAPQQDPLVIHPQSWPRDLDTREEEEDDDRPIPNRMKPAPVYTGDSDTSTVLVIPDPYSMVYVYWLMTKIDMQNQEDARYNVDRAQFENAYDTASDWWTRTHMPVQRTREFSL